MQMHVHLSLLQNTIKQKLVLILQKKVLIWKNTIKIIGEGW